MNPAPLWVADMIPLHCGTDTTGVISNVMDEARTTPLARSGVVHREPRSVDDSILASTIRSLARVDRLGSLAGPTGLSSIETE
jgi:hypothetical protein